MRKAMAWTMALAAIALFVLASHADAGAQKKKPRAVKRHQVQKDRIKHGVQDGSLTKREAGRLAHEQKHIKKVAKDAAADGDVTLKEKARLEHMQNKANKHIAIERHDAQGEMGPKPPPTADPGVNKRQRVQRHRIGHGIKSGSLTREEVHRIIAEEKKIAGIEHAMKSDGKLTIAERKTLHELLNETSKLIFQEKHDDETRPQPVSADGRADQPKPPSIKKEIRNAVESGDMTHAEAKALLGDLHRIHELKRILATQSLSEEQRAKLAAELDALVNAIHD